MRPPGSMPLGQIVHLSANIWLSPQCQSGPSSVTFYLQCVLSTAGGLKPIPHFQQRNYLQLFFHPHIDWHTWYATLYWHRYTGKHTSDVRVFFWVTCSIYQQSALINAMKKRLWQGKDISLVAQATCLYKGCKSKWVGNLTRIFYAVALKQILALRSVLPFPPCFYPIVCPFP